MNTQTVLKKYSEKTKGQKILRTFFLVLVWVCLGLYLEITGPTLLDLKLRTGADYEEVAVAVSGRSLGYFIGSAIGGVLVDRFIGHCDLMIGICLTGGAISTVFVPWAPIVQLMWFIIILQGTFEGVINIAGQKLIMMMWEHNSASPLNILHGGFGIGSFIIPLIANPFLAVIKPPLRPNISTALMTNFSMPIGGMPRGGIPSGGKSQLSLMRRMFNKKSSSMSFPSSNMGMLNMSLTNSSTTFKLEFLRESRIEFAYLISAIITIALSVVFFIYHVSNAREMKSIAKTSKSKKNRVSIRPLQRIKNSINPATCADGNTLYGVAMFSALFMFYINVIGGERILGKFIRAYAIEQLDFSVADGSYLNTAFWASFAVGRLSGFFAARWIPVRILLLIETGGVLISTIFLNIFAPSSALGLWITLQPLALFHAPCYPTCMGWANYHIEMTGMAICFLLLGGSLGGIAYLRLTGFLFEHFGAGAFLWQILGYGIIAFVMAIILNLISAKHGSRFTKDKADVDIIENKGDKEEHQEML